MQKSVIFTTVKGKRLIMNLPLIDPTWLTQSSGLLCYLSKGEEALGARFLIYLVFPHPSCLDACVCPFFESAEVMKHWRQNIPQ